MLVTVAMIYHRENVFSKREHDVLFVSATNQPVDEVKLFIENG